ncbi:helix-turn-helix domain-containing protein [Schaalia hyovaginalis]|uniref:helix-turn-helix domain-containing protein n=1 Tax=Schaalia hyovaginalis TaxID=29316 RepID=UPI0038B304E3
MTVNQHLFAAKMSGNSFAPILGVSGATVSRKLRGQVGWTVTDLLTTATFFGITPGDLMPKPDGLGGWIPAPFRPAHVSTANELVPQVGLEPTTDGL